MELTLRMVVDLEFNVEDEEREDGGGPVEEAFARAVRVVVPTLSALAARSGVTAPGDSGSELGGDSEIGEVTNVVSRRRSRASSIKRLVCSSAASHFFAELKCIWRSRRPCTSITMVCSFEILQRSCPLIPLTRVMGIR